MILRGRHKCMTAKLVGIQWFLVTQMNITNLGVLVFSWLTYLNTLKQKI